MSDGGSNEYHDAPRHLEQQATLASALDQSPCAVVDPHAARSLRRRRQWVASQYTPTTPMAMVANQDDTTMTTVRLDGKGSPVISTLSLGPVQADAIGGVTFSLGEWIFVTNTDVQQGGIHRSDRRPGADSGDFFGRKP